MAKDPRELFESQLPLIERLIGSICRRYACRRDEAEDFGSWVKVRLLEDDCAALRKFQGRSSLPTYLTTVIHNYFRDYRISKWGRWRPSAAARRLGAVAVQLETLLARDGLTFDEAAEILRSNFGVARAVAELADLAARLPPRVPRRFEGEEALAALGSSDGVERRVEDAERAEIAGRTERALAAALEELEGEDRLILKMRFQDGFTVSGIARALDLAQRPLYRRIEACLLQLRTALEARGLDAGEVRELFRWEASTLAVDYAAGDERPARSPST